MDVNKLEISNAKAEHDIDSGITFIAYNGVLDGAVTIQVYQWLDDLYDSVGLENIFGQIFDFREVEGFDQSNLTTARRTSNRMNMSKNTSQFPVALVVKDAAQEEILRGPMRIPEGHARKQIVRTMDDARTFLEEWNKQKQS
jgi:hypothetical protein